MSQTGRRNAVILAGWTFGNFAAVGAIAFCDHWLPLVVGWLWVSVALSLACLPVVGSLFCRHYDPLPNRDQP